jgi:ZIP family zinc transporter
MPALALLPFFSTLAGGMAALRFRHRLHPFMAFAAGVLVATAIADLLPEATDLVGGHGLQVAIAFLAGYLLFALLESFIHQQSLEHGHVEHDHGPGGSAAGHQRSRLGSAGSRGRGRGIVGLLPPSSLIVHSTLDGFAIGVAFQAGTGLGLVVLLAVLAHDFADGMNVVTLALEAARGRGLAIGFLVLDALAPVFGAALSFVIAIPDVALGWLIAWFAGVFIAIGAGHLLPESQHERPAEAPVLVGLATVGAILVVIIRAVGV